MATRRDELDALLRNTVGTGKEVYFQPPENFRLSYPCLTYEMTGIHSQHADNQPYTLFLRWELTYITRDPDDPVIFALAALPQCSMGRPFTSDNLYHYPYTIHY